MSLYDLIAPFEDDVDYQTFSPEKYDASGGDPEAWRLCVRLTAPGQRIVAAIAGQLSTVPPDEIPPSGIPVKIPRQQDGALAATDDQGPLTPLPAITPESTTLYLSPFEGEGASAFADVLRGAGFGTEIRWVKYTNVDVESLRELTLTIPRLGQVEGMTDDDVFAAFLAVRSPLPLDPVRRSAAFRRASTTGKSNSRSTPMSGTRIPWRCGERSIR
jgi:hypothetical protein